MMATQVPGLTAALQAAGKGVLQPRAPERFLFRLEETPAWRCDGGRGVGRQEPTASS
jgi:hypothetical protein